MRLSHVAFIGAFSALAACSGEQGQQGPPGPQGTQGTGGTAGATGAAGVTALTKTSTEAAGTNCANGGTKVEVGLDKDGNGTLDAAEVTGTQYVCNGNGKNTLVKTTPEPGGANCPYGGTKIETGLDANSNNVLDAAEITAAATTYACNVAPAGTISPSTGIVVGMKTGAVSTSTTAPITVRFTLKDDRGFPVDINGKYSQNAAIQPRFALGYYTKDAAGNALPLVTYTKSGATPMPTAYNPKGTAAGHGTLVENGVGAGDYTYTFPTADTTGGAVKVAYDGTKLGESHVAWVQVSRQTDEIFPSNANTFYAANQDFWFIPSGTGTAAKREIAAQANCDKCHSKFKAETTTSAAFHGGGRIDVNFCVVCHNPGRTSNLQADSRTFVHRIHNGEHVRKANAFHGIEATYPQDVRNCDGCHKGAAQGAQAVNLPTKEACTGCHDNVKFDSSAAVACLTKPVDADGRHADCNHVIPQPDNTGCAATNACHNAAKVAEQHKPVIKPDPANSWNGGANIRTNAANVAAAGYVPTGAAVITADVKSVDVWDDAGTKRPSITFKLKNNGADVVFPTYAAGSVEELMPNFIGSPNVYFAMSVPQDGNNTPSDFNAAFGANIRAIWSGAANTPPGTGSGTISAPDASGYYTIKLTGVVIPATAKQLTGGVGYAYDLGGPSYTLKSNAPLTQTNVTGYPLSADGKNQGGLVVPIPNVWKVATGYTGRRPIVDNNKCKDCHGVLGVAPSFHVGQRNDGPTCSFCHTPNRTSSGWSAGSKYFIHGIHAGRKRTVPYTWHATQVGPGYGEVEFPGTLNKCTTCHLPNTYDFTSATNLAAVANQQLTTVATLTYDRTDTNPSYYTIAPYVDAKTVSTPGTNYGSGFSFTSSSGAIVDAAPTTLVISQVTTACSSCHDSATAIDHMRQNGGRFYDTRANATAPGAAKEQCMMCHGPGRVAAIGAVHTR